LETHPRLFSKAWKMVGLLLTLLGSALNADEPRLVVTSQLELEFRDGWLTRWKNKLTDEEIQFGRGRAIPEATGGTLLKADEAAVALTQSGAAVWAIRLPRDRVTLYHAEGGTLRQRYLLLQGRSGGLLLLLDEPAGACRATLERDEGRKEITLTLRAGSTTAEPVPVRWLIRQYVGGAN